MRRNILFLILVLITVSLKLYSQSEDYSLKFEIKKDTSSHDNALKFKLVEKEATPTNMKEIQKKLVFPKSLKDSFNAGTVVLHILVDENGNYVKHKVISSTHPLFTKKVEKIVRQLKFEPGIADGKPTKMWIYLSFNFKNS